MKKAEEILDPLLRGRIEYSIWPFYFAGFVFRK